jgi:RsiW-degrading membrane proteinase PrsW (M82 family)
LPVRHLSVTWNEAAVVVFATFRDNGAPMVRLRDIFFTPEGRQRLFRPALLVLVVTFVVGFVALRAVQQALPDEDRAAALARTGKFALAEQIYVRLLREKPSVTTAIALVENHQRGSMMMRMRGRSGRGSPGPGLAQEPPSMHGEESVMTDEALDELLDKTLSSEVGLVTRFWRAVDRGTVPSDLHDAVAASADKDPPLAWYNHALAREAFHQHDLDEAAKRFEREALAFPERHEDLDRALTIWMEADAWEHVRERMQDARVSAIAGPMTKYQFAVHERDWRSAAKWLGYGWRPRFTVPSLVMTAIAALAWGFFCARLGKLGERPVRRALFYLAAFVLGVLSVVPTVCLIAVEEAQLRLVATGDATRDILFYVFGVGLREEASKLLLFTPLLFVLRKWGDKLDVLVCGAMVGLGFAAEENLGYLAGGDLHTGLGRFLTANFLHMAMTAILATALDDFMEDREKHAADFSRTTVMVVVMHGGYDFLLSHEEFGGSYFAMAVFFVLVKMFLTAVEHARRKADHGITLTQAFVVALAIVTGTSAVYAVAAVGPVSGAIVMAEGLLGVAILIYAFVRTLREM